MGARRAPTAEPIRLDEAIPLYLADMKLLERSDSIIGHSRCILNGLAARLGPGTILSKVDGKMIKDAFYLPHPTKPRKYPAWATSVAGSTFNGYRHRVGAFLSWCLQEGYVTDRHLMSLTQPRKIIEPERPRLPVAAVVSLPDMARSARDRFLIIVGLEHGPRASELQRMLIGHYDPAQRTLIKIMKKSRTREEIREVMKLTPAGDAEMIVWLRAYAQTMGITYEQILTKRDWYLFPKQQEYATGRNTLGHPARHRTVYFPAERMGPPWRVVRKAIEALGLTDADMGRGRTHHSRSGRKQSLGEHTLRYTMAMHLEERAGIEATCSALGHADIRVTRNYVGMTREKKLLWAEQNSGGYRAAAIAAMADGKVTPIRRGAQGG